MVPPSSHGISRAPRYFGYCSSTFVFTYRILTFFDQPSHAVRLTIIVLNAVLNPERIAPLGLASSAFARHYSQNLGWFLFLALLRCFSSGGSPHIPIWFSIWCMCIHIRIAPFGNLRINSYLLIPAAYRSLSRPSSAPNAKAFSLRSSQLNHFWIMSNPLNFYANCRFFTRL